MKKIIALMALLTPAVFAADLSITIENIQNSKGDIRVALFSERNKGNFPNGKPTMITNSVTSQQVSGIVVPAKEGTMYIQVSAPAGIYAVSALHDENSDGKINKVFLSGIPLEPYGFSNDARAAFSAPNFSQAQFELPKSGLKISFDMMGHYADSTGEN